jgi:hypothetical protein
LAQRATGTRARPLVTRITEAAVAGEEAPREMRCGRKAVMVSSGEV